MRHFSSNNHSKSFSASTFFWVFCVLLCSAWQFVRFSLDSHHAASRPKRDFDYAAPLLFRPVNPVEVEQPVIINTTRAERHVPNKQDEESSDVPSEWLPSLQASIQPLHWQCTNKKDPVPPQPSTLIFVHVFKTAGSTMRNFFRMYARKQCSGTSYATLIHCTNAQVPNVSSISPEPWKDCHLKEYLRRKGRDWYSTNRDRKNVNSTFLHQSVDIVGGHFKMGTLDHLTMSSTTRTMDDHVGRPHRHVVFFRDAAAKYVSGKIFVQTTHHPKSEHRMEIILEKIQKEVDHAARAPGTSYHQKYGDYLLTPAQVQTCHDQKCSVKDKADWIKKNLLTYNVTVGMVERMKESMDVLHYVMEPRRDDPQTKAFYRKFATSKSRNVSPISTGQVMKELKKIHNGTTYANLLEFVRYEQEITDFAMKLHKWQYAQIQKLRRST